MNENHCQGGCNQTTFTGCDCGDQWLINSWFLFLLHDKEIDKEIGLTLPLPLKHTKQCMIRVDLMVVIRNNLKRFGFSKLFHQRNDQGRTTEREPWRLLVNVSLITEGSTQQFRKETGLKSKEANSQTEQSLVRESWVKEGQKVSGDQNALILPSGICSDRHSFTPVSSLHINSRCCDR